MSANGKKIAAAALSGLMAAGTLPVAAIAETTSVETQASSDNTAFANGNLTLTVDGVDSLAKDGNNGYKFTYDGQEHTVGLYYVNSATGESKKVTLNATQTEFEANGKTYIAQLDGADLSQGKIKDANTYTVSVFEKNSQAPITKTTIKVEPKELKGATAAALTYNTTDQKNDVAISLDGVGALKQGTDYDIDHIEQTSDKGTVTVPNITDAGTYTVYIKAHSNNFGAAAGLAPVTVTVNKLDLSTAEIKGRRNGNDKADDVLEEITVNGVANSGNKFGLAIKGDGSEVADHVYKYVVSASTNKNVTGTADFTTTDTALDVTSRGVRYGSAWAGLKPSDPNHIVDIDLDSNQKFDASKLTVKANENGTGDVLTSNMYTVTYEKKDANGNWVAASEADLAYGGDYRASVSVDTAKSNYKYQGGTSKGSYLYFHIFHSKAANVYVSVNGTNIGNDTDKQSDAWLTYDGNDLTSFYKVTVKDAAGNELKQGEDYSVTYKKVDANNPQKTTDVTEIKDAGNYQIIVKALRNYTFVTSQNGIDTTNVWVKQKPVNVALSKANQLDVKNKENRAEYAYTGSAIVPQFDFTNAQGDKIDVPADQYTVTYKTADDNPTQVDSITKAGHYTVTVSMPNGGNYTFASNPGSASSTSFDIEVTEDRSFKDVANDAWYAQVVATAKQKGYIHGVGGSDLFAPETNITRGDVLTILWNAAKAAGKVPAQFSSDSNKSFDTGFADVDGSKYYAQAIAWAKATGVANGYPDGTFAPEQKITREEFAAFLYNYAKAVNGDAAGTAADYASFPDADGVSDWAEGPVAWAVKNKVMGNGGVLRANEPITRAEAAAMVVNYLK